MLFLFIDVEVFFGKMNDKINYEIIYLNEDFFGKYDNVFVFVFCLILNYWWINGIVGWKNKFFNYR